MPFFNFRRNGSPTAPNAGASSQHESVEVVRKRAKHRLIGAAVLVLAGVVGFPLLFDTQPRPIAIDIPIEIPGKNTVKPLVMPGKQAAAPIATAPQEAPTVAAPPPVAVPERVTAGSSLTSKEQIIGEKGAVAQAIPAPAAIKTEAKPDPKALPKAEARAEAKPEPKVEAKPAAKPAAPQDDGARAKALLNGQAAVSVANASPEPSSPASAGADKRIVVQVGAFADVVKAREARLKLEKVGLKTYTQVAETAGGKRIRVRVGPFATRAEAEKAASKIKALDLAAAILTL